ncbi:hypothetical protein D3C78_1369270 [compost metagenome]
MTLLDVSHMKPGDHAGLVALQNGYGTVGVKAADNGDRYIAMCVNSGGSEETVEHVRLEGCRIYLKIVFNFENSIDLASFYYAQDGINWIQIGRPLEMKYTLDHFMGYRIGLYNYATRVIGGYVDFDCFRYARINERPQ